MMTAPEEQGDPNTTLAAPPQDVSPQNLRVSTSNAGPRTLDQLRAAYAWQCIQSVRQTSARDRDEYRDLVRRLPAMIQTNGLGQALAFLLVQKGGKRALYNDLQEWLCDGQRPVYPNPSLSDTPALLSTDAMGATRSNTRLIERLTQGDSRTLRLATREAQAVSSWLKRFAEASELQDAQVVQATQNIVTGE